MSDEGVCRTAPATPGLLNTRQLLDSWTNIYSKYTPRYLYIYIFRFDGHKVQISCFLTRDAERSDWFRRQSHSCNHLENSPSLCFHKAIYEHKVKGKFIYNWSKKIPQNP